jgi:putative ABC transport system permease protein
VKEVFGLPAGPLSFWLAVLLAVSVGAVTVLALRNLVFLKMGLRNIPRRRARSALIVVGLMLGTTIISSALLTGDTMATTVRASVIETLGQTDETITAGTDTDVGADPGLEAPKAYFDASSVVAVVDRAVDGLPVDGVLPAIVETVGAQHAAAGRTEPRLTLFAPDPGRAAAFGFGAVSDLHGTDGLLNEEAADELGAAPGDDIVVLIGDRITTVHIAGVDAFDGVGTDGSALVLSLAGAEQLIGRSGQVNQILVSNTGGSTSGVRETDVVEPALDAAVADLGLDAQPSKRDGLDAADATGNTFVQLFTTFGTFSMAAGVLLIFLIFVMLAGERRPEMGMARAVGTQRRHLVQTFLYEGAAYDLAAAAVGAVLGIGISFVMVRAVANAFSTEDFDLSYSLSARSLIIAYGLGVLLTLLVVTLSAWRVSRLNIVSAIRDLPEESTGGHRRTKWGLVVVGVVLGGAMAASGASAASYLPWMLGVSIVIMSAIPIVRLTGRSERAAFTLAGGALVVLWLLPLSTFDGVFGDMAMDFSVWIAGGLIIVVAATWLVTYNADVLLGALSWLTSPFASLRPVVKMAVAYPLRTRFRTGVTMAMFMLVVFTLVTGTTIPSAFVRAFDDVDTFGGGFDIRASTAPVAAVSDLRPELPAGVAKDIVAAGAQSFVPVEARQDTATRDYERYPLRGVDRGFIEHTTYGFSAMAKGYTSARQVWDAVRSQPGLAVVDSFIAPRRQNWGFGVVPAFHLTGFYVDDGSFTPVPVTARDPMTGATLKLTVIGVLSDNAPYSMAGITVAQAVMAPFGDRANPTVHHLAVREGADVEAVAAAVEGALLSRGVEAETYASILDDAVGANILFIRLVQGFMALGLVVGVAALGVISARAVVERRQQLGMLRAIGFQPEMIRRTLLAESAIVAITAVAVGTVLGLILSYNVIADSSSQPGWANVTFQVPWLNLGIVFFAVIAAALLTTLASAMRATRIYPAEALRYQ